MLIFDDLSMTCSNYLTCNAQVHNCDIKPIYAENNIYHCPGFRLPTQTEWGTFSRRGDINSPINNRFSADSESLSYSSPQMIYNSVPDYYSDQPNAIFDTLGNVSEWTIDDIFSSSTSGSYTSDPIGTIQSCGKKSLGNVF